MELLVKTFHRYGLKSQSETLIHGIYDPLRSDFKYSLYEIISNVIARLVGNYNVTPSRCAIKPFRNLPKVDLRVIY